MVSLLDSHSHHCFHSPRCNVHIHPDRHVCATEGCRVSVHPEMVSQAGLKQDDGSIVCPSCGGITEFTPGSKLAEVHVKLCTDETIHYPEKHKAGEITTEQFEQWKSTLTREELLGFYKRVPDIHLTVKFTHEETALMDTDLPAFNALLLDRMKHRAEMALLHQAPHQHQTTSVNISLPKV